MTKSKDTARKRARALKLAIQNIAGRKVAKYRKVLVKYAVADSA